jgi:DNA polymerase I-like protein with 3'-5' exonuclease and polymerase domains
MANPLLALEEIGYRVDPRARREFEERIRFSVEQVAQLRQLRKRASQICRRGLDPDVPADVHKMLFEELGLTRQTATATFDTPAALEYLPRPGWLPTWTDPLEALRGHHELVDVLLQYRAVEASEPRLATREFFDAVRNGHVNLRLRSAVIRLRAAS